MMRICGILINFILTTKTTLAMKTNTTYLPNLTPLRGIAALFTVIFHVDLMMGNGDSANLHNAAYNFNDAAIAPGAAYWTHLVERYLKAA